jgi:hypothetical protein
VVDAYLASTAGCALRVEPTMQTFSDQQRQDRTSEDKHKLALRDASWMESVYLFMLITNDIWVLFFC